MLTSVACVVLDATFFSGKLVRSGSFFLAKSIIRHLEVAGELIQVKYIAWRHGVFFFFSCGSRFQAVYCIRVSAARERTNGSLRGQTSQTGKRHETSAGESCHTSQKTTRGQRKIPYRNIGKEKTVWRGKYNSICTLNEKTYTFTVRTYSFTLNRLWKQGKWYYSS